jgi:hypothetical protein
MRRTAPHDERRRPRAFSPACCSVLRRVAALFIAVAMITVLPQSDSVFTGSTTSAGTWGTAASFPTYPQSVVADGAQFYHRLSDATTGSASSNAADSSGNDRIGIYNGATNGTPMTAGTVGALQGVQQGQQADSAVAFSGTGNGYNPIQYVNPTTFSLEAWFKTSSSSGGSILGFGLSQTATGGNNRDRIVYVDSAARLTFGVVAPGVVTLRSAGTVNDGAWHHVVATLGPAGMRLYLDGSRIGANASITTAENFNGYWRWGGIGLLGWPNRPTSDYFIGTIDEVAVYPTQLSDQQVSRHYASNH